MQEFTYRACGVVLEPERHYLLDGRLQRVALRLGFRSVDEFVRAACAPGAGQNLTDPLLDAITTHETSFFRDPAFWRTLEEQILPPLVQTGRPLSIWSAACATGQEALSLAMLLAERWPAAFDSVRILATDVSGDTIARARASTYNVVEVNRGLEPERLVRHFDVVPRGFRAKAALRERIVYMVHNLLGAAPYPSGFDLVLCRNVLIYFNDVDRKRVVERLFRSAEPGGLGVGVTELVVGGRSLGSGWYSAEGAGAPR
ncbi:MAG TPA: protein-glutamate O-methyltransferase CheR [Haliangiales bacterium]|nr:protein-glutamate O-methyltransferase CheR [Haliangiales bacterium]